MRGLGAEPQIRQGGLGEDGDGEADGGLHDERGHRVGKDVPADQRGVPRPERPGGEDELPVPELEEARAREPGEDGQEGHADRHHADPQARAEHGAHQERGQDGGKALDGVHQPHEALVEPAAEVAGQHAERDPDAHADAHRDHAHHDRIDRPRHDAREQVAAELIGAQPVRGGRALEAPGDRHLERVPRRVDQAHRRRQDERERDREAEGERDVAERAAARTGLRAAWRRPSPRHS